MVRISVTYVYVQIQSVRKRLNPFCIFFRCPVCGKWCKLHWLLLDTPSFYWNTRRSPAHKIFKMAPTKQQKAFCAVEYAKTMSVITVQRNFRRQFEVDPPDKKSIKRWHTQLMETGCLCKGKSTGRPSHSEETGDRMELLPISIMTWDGTWMNISHSVG